jgi:hypothetical protein
MIEERVAGIVQILPKLLQSSAKPKSGQPEEMVIINHTERQLQQNAAAT